MKKFWFWGAFAIVQFCGIYLPTFANVHTNPGPLLFMFLLLPGLILALPFENQVLSSGLAVAVNGFCWWLAAWVYRKAKALRSEES
jgi:hypothetical protein